MRKLTAILLCVILAGLTRGVEPMTLAIQFSGYTKTEPLTNFPVLVSLNGYAGFLSGNGYDVRFWTNSAATGTPLNYEIESWTNSGTSYVWVQVPVLTNSATIYATWGIAAYNSQEAYTTNGATWSNGFAAVWHMNQTNVIDSTRHIANGTSSNNTNTVGMANGAQGFNGSSAYIRTPTYSLPSPLTVEAWTYAPSYNGSYNGSLVQKSPVNTEWTLFFEFGILKWRGGGTTSDVVYQMPIAAGWHFCVGQAVGTNASLYVDGSLKTNGPSKAIPNGSGTIQLGTIDSGQYTYWLNGIEDEVRISTVARSSNWLWATYQNIASNSAFQSSVFIPKTFTFYSPPAPTNYLATVVFSGYNRSEPLTNFPALVVISNAYGSANGYDFRFWTNSAAIGTPLNYEVDTFSASSGSPSYFWVQVPVLTNNSTIYATWGSPISSVPQPYTTNGATWANGYGAVWHLSSTNDSSTNMATLTLTGSSLTAGLLGSSIALTGSTPYASSPASITNFPLTMSVWYKFNAQNWLANSGPILISAYNPASTKEFWVDWYNSSGTMIRNVVQDGGTYVGSYTSTPDTGWHQLTSIFPSAGTSQLFMDGKQITFTSASGSGTPTGVSKFAVGGLVYNGSTWYNSPVNGLEDEARWSSVARSTNWVWAEYQTMASNSTFQTTTLAFPQPTVFLYGSKVNGNTFPFISK